MNDINIEYPFLIRNLSKCDGGGFVIEFPDLPGCLSDGETIEETIENGRDAVFCWLETAKEAGWIIPEPGYSTTKKLYSGKWVQRVPKSLHKLLALRADNEGVSFNTLVVSMLSESLGKRAYDVPRTQSRMQKFAPVADRKAARINDSRTKTLKKAAKGTQTYLNRQASTITNKKLGKGKGGREHPRGRTRHS